MTKFLAVTCVVGFAALSVACGTEPIDNSFTATLSGDTSHTFEGEAIFGVSTSQTHENWVIVLSRGTPGGLDFDAIAIGRHRSGTPIGEGTYVIEDAEDDTLEDDDIDAVYILRRSEDGALGQYNSLSGTLTITSADSDEVRGEFTFTTSHYLSSGSFEDVIDLTISGSFTAIRGNVPSAVS